MTFIFIFGFYLSQNFAPLLSALLGQNNEEDDAKSSQSENFLPALTSTDDGAQSADIVIDENGQAVEFIPEHLPTVSPDPTRASFPVVNTVVGGGTAVSNFYVKDTSGASVDLLTQLEKDLPFDTSDLSEPTVLIYHTHGTESYFLSPVSYYYGDDSFRSAAYNENVTVVGAQMKKVLEEHGIGVIHDTTLHDDISYNGSYSRSKETVNSYLEKYPSITVTIDVHRDSLTTDEGLKYRPVIEIDGKQAAQVMIITGSDPDGSLDFPTWEENLILALKLQEEAATTYPGLMRPLMYCQRVYNMNATNASLLFEIGAEVNTFSQAKYAGELMANVLANVLKNG